MAERNLVGEAADDIPRLRHRGEQQHHRRHPQFVAARVEDERQQRGADEEEYEQAGSDRVGPAGEKTGHLKLP